MEIQELRIGSLIMGEDGIHCVVDINTTVEGDGIVNGFDMLYFEPIPITEEWLLNCSQYATYGEEKWISLTNLNAELHFEIYSRELHPTVIISIIKNKFGEIILDEIKYIHQLQNLYFALTGEELMIKD